MYPGVACDEPRLADEFEADAAPAALSADRTLNFLQSDGQTAACAVSAVEQPLSFPIRTVFGNPAFDSLATRHIPCGFSYR